MTMKAGVLALLASAVVMQAQGIHLKHDPYNQTTLNRWLADEPRVFFFAGIEGSGAKIFQQVWFDHFNDTSYPSNHDRAHHILHFPEGWSCGDTWQAEKKVEMVQKLEALQDNEIWSLPYQATYPSCGINGDHSIERMHNFHPHLDWLQAAAQEAGVRLHVIYLHRPLAETLALDCINRTYATCATQAAVINANAKILKKQMDNLTNDVVSCFQYGHEADMQATILEKFQLNHPEEMVKIFQSRDLRDSVHELEAEVTQTVAHQNGIMDTLCDTMDAFNLDDFHYILTRTHIETEHTGEHRMSRWGQ